MIGMAIKRALEKYMRTYDDAKQSGNKETIFTIKIQNYKIMIFLKSLYSMKLFFVKVKILKLLNKRTNFHLQQRNLFTIDSAE